MVVGSKYNHLIDSIYRLYTSYMSLSMGLIHWKPVRKNTPHACYAVAKLRTQLSKSLGISN